MTHREIAGKLFDALYDRSVAHDYLPPYGEVVGKIESVLCECLPPSSGLTVSIDAMDAQSFSDFLNKNPQGLSSGISNAIAGGNAARRVPLPTKIGTHNEPGSHNSGK